MAFETEPRIVDVRVIFMRLGTQFFLSFCKSKRDVTCFAFVGQINTLSDQFDGEASLEIEWLDSDVIDEYDSKKHWNPNIYIYNALGELKQQMKYTVRKSESGGTIICEQQQLKGAYYETLELNNVSLHL